MPRSQDDNYDPRERPQAPRSSTPPAYVPPTYDYVRTDPDGTRVFRGNDGSLYTESMTGPNGFEYVPYSGPAAPTQTSAPPTSNPPGGTDPNFIWSGTFTPPTPQSLGGPLGLPNLPNFAPPEFPTIPKFNAPTADAILSDPSYLVREGRGRDSLQNWAAAKGTLNDSSTADALIDYGQNSASQEYGNIWSRDFDVYQNDVNNNYLMPFAAKYKSWSDAVLGPQLHQYDTQSAALQHQNDMNYSNAWNKFLTDIDIFRDRRNTALSFA